MHQPAAEPARSIMNHIITHVMKSLHVLYSQSCIPDAAEASAGAASGLGNLTGPPGEAGLEVVVVTQVPLGAFQCTATGPASPEVIPAAPHGMPSLLVLQQTYPTNTSGNAVHADRSITKQTQEEELKPSFEMNKSSLAGQLG